MRMLPPVRPGNEASIKNISFRHGEERATASPRARFGRFKELLLDFAGRFCILEGETKTDGGRRRFLSAGESGDAG